VDDPGLCFSSRFGIFITEARSFLKLLFIGQFLLDVFLLIVFAIGGRPFDLEIPSVPSFCHLIIQLATIEWSGMRKIKATSLKDSPVFNL